jgi:hypothetical protein
MHARLSKPYKAKRLWMKPTKAQHMQAPGNMAQQKQQRRQLQRRHQKQRQQAQLRRLQQPLLTCFQAHMATREHSTPMCRKS